MSFPSLRTAVLRWLPRQESILKAAWAATLIPLAAFGYLTWRSVALNTEVTSLEVGKQQLHTRVDQLKTEVAQLEAKRVEALVDFQRGDCASAEDKLIEAAGVGTTPAPVPSDALSRRQLIQQLFDPDPSVRVKAYGGLVPRYKNDESLVPELLEVARDNPRNANGIYNTLVVLSHMDRDTLRARSEEVRTFAEAQASAGPRVKARVETLVRRLPPVS
jgi:hypothetical protein